MKVLDKLYFWYYRQKQKLKDKKERYRIRKQIIRFIAYKLDKTSGTIIADHYNNPEWNISTVKEICHNLKIPICIKTENHKVVIHIDRDKLRLKN